MNFTFSLTIDAQGIQRTRWSRSTSWAWKDISDVRIGPSPQSDKVQILQIQVAGQAPDTGGWIGGFSFPGLSKFRLLETVRKGLLRWGSPTARQTIAATLEQQRRARDDGSGEPIAEIDSEAKRQVRARKTLRWVGLGIIILIPAAIQMAFAQGRFIPNSMALSWGPIGVGALVAAVIFYVVSAARNKPSRGAKTIGRQVLVVAVMLVLCLYWGSQEFLIALPDAYTRWAGAPAVRHVTALRWYPESRGRRHHTCAGVEITDLPSLLGRLCLNRQVSPGTDLLLHGRQSVLGFHVDTLD
jgi:hypothetical protein